MNKQQRDALEQAAKTETDREYGNTIYSVLSKAKGKRLFKLGAEWMEANQWIPVTERLPDEFGMYEVTFDNRAKDFLLFYKGKWLLPPTGRRCGEPLIKPLQVIAWRIDAPPYSPSKTTDNEK